ncbi:hypothetical protein [Clostridium sp. LP20]|uniref:hypothetical protein n=1 Tax=Clostridium sp. LP20 TaxID=3418665 RepID=UPI003EE67A95
MKKIIKIIIPIVGFIICFAIMMLGNLKINDYRIASEKEKVKINSKYQEDLKKHMLKEPERKVYTEDEPFTFDRGMRAAEENLKWEKSKPKEPIEELELVEKEFSSKQNRVYLIYGGTMVLIFTLNIIFILVNLIMLIVKKIKKRSVMNL